MNSIKMRIFQTMSKMNAKSLSGLRQKLRKYNKEVMETDITAYKANPDPAGYESPEDEVKVRDRGRGTTRRDVIAARIRR